MKDLLRALNEPQRQAVTHEGGPLLILAGAGSGKTRTITYRVAYLIEQSACPAERILAVTFTNKAAEEMRNRVLGLLPKVDAPPLVSTFHSFGVRVLRRHAPKVGFGNNFTICDTDDQERLLKQIYKRLELDPKEIKVREARSAISRAKNKGWGPADLAKKGHRADSEILADVYRSYQHDLRNSNALDFDDLILLTVHLFQEEPSVRDNYSDWFRHLLIDEYQDTNAPQYDLIQSLTSLHDNVCAVGDEDQSIYGFRGADINNILRFEEDFPGTRLIKLEQNYRSTQLILDAAGAVVANNAERKGKELWSERKTGPKIDFYLARNAADEARWVSGKIAEYRRRGSKHIAILYRTNALSRAFEEALRQSRIPHRIIGGLSFYSRKEIKDTLAYLRLARNPSDNVSMLRVINEPSRGIGGKTLEALQAFSREKAGGDLWRGLETGLAEQAFPARAHRVLQRFQEIVRKCSQALEGNTLPAAIERILEVSGYGRALKDEGTEQADNRILNLKELLNVAADYEERGVDIQQFLDEASLRADTDDYDSEAPVVLMTLHNAKGLEFDTVFLVGWEDGLFPHQRAILENDVEEERRICYVGMTRAERKLHVSYSRRRRFYGRDSNEFSSPSRFLSEIPDELMERMESPKDYLYERAGRSQPERLFPRPAQRRRKPKRAFKGISYDTPEEMRRYLDRKSASTAPSKPRLREGSFVEHPKWGRGKVLRVEKAKANDLKVTVRFPMGIKKVLQSYAQLKVV